MPKVAFVCVGNAGRSQMATAFAEREARARGLDVEVATGGVDPADAVHEDVVAAMGEAGMDVGDRVPRAIRPDDVADCDYVVTMGCSVDDLLPADWTGRASRWELDHPGGDLDAVRAQRDEIRARVERFFDELAGEGRS